MKDPQLEDQCAMSFILFFIGFIISELWFGYNKHLKHHQSRTH